MSSLCTRDVPAQTGSNVAAVVKFAASLRERAARIQADDVWAKPYAPSEAVARKLASSVGPEKALKILKERATEVDLDYREGEEVARRAAIRHERRMKVIEQQARERRSRLSYGRRIDDALSKLSTVSAIPAASIDVDQITGKAMSSGPIPDDLFPRVEMTARLAAESVERELDNARRRALSPGEPDRDVRLRELVHQGLSPEHIGIADPSQGSPSRIRHRAKELGLCVEESK